MSGLPPAWKRIYADQIEHSSHRARIVKLTFQAGGNMYVINYKDKKDHWCRHPSSPQDLKKAIEIAEGFL